MSQNCKRCEEIDWDAKISDSFAKCQTGRPGWAIFVCPLYISASTGCAICQFFWRTKHSLSGRDHQRHILWVLSGRHVFKLPPAIADFPVLYAETGESERPGFPRHQGSRGVKQIQDWYILQTGAENSLTHGIASKVDYTLVRGWMDLCSSTHPANCNPPMAQRQAIKGFKVIECSTRRIINLKNDSSAEEYVTLSYVWGESTEVNASPGVLPDSTPLLIDDAILVTKNLGFKYLWIDRYCIPQNNEIEKFIQIQRMGEIYHYSVLTLIAASGYSPAEGLPGVSTRPRPDSPSIKLGKHTYVAAPNAHIEMRHSKWATRGWTYQEGLMARRRLVFTPSQVHFQCMALCRVETIHLQPDELIPFSDIKFYDDHYPQMSVPGYFPRSEIDRLAGRIVEYSKKDLTYDNDMLNAFKGILAMFEQKTPPTGHLHGLPLPSARPSGFDTKTLTEALCWRIVSSKRQLDAEFQRLPMFPSWTWIGWKLCTPESSLWFPSVRVLRAFINIAVECESGQVLPWDGNHDEISRRFRDGDLPTTLHIRGFALGIELSLSGSFVPQKSNLKLSKKAFEFAAVVAKRGHLLELIKKLDIRSSIKNTFQFAFLILACMRSECSVMVLNRSEGASIYERVTAVAVEPAWVGFNFEDFDAVDLGWEQMDLVIS